MQWHIALSQPNQEKTAFAHLRRLRYEAYYPVEPRRRVLYGKETPYFRPMFLRYLFVKLGANRDWYRLETAPGIQVSRGLLNLDGENYATITEDEMEAIRETAKALHEQMFTRTKDHPFDVGDGVKIKVGQFAEFLATIMELDDDARTMGLRTYIFNRQVEIPRVSFDAVVAA